MSSTAEPLPPIRSRHEAIQLRLKQALQRTAVHSMHVYEVRPRKDKRGADLISDVLPFERILYGEPNAWGQRFRPNQSLRRRQRL
jgi:hypothetical protein